MNIQIHQNISQKSSDISTSNSNLMENDRNKHLELNSRFNPIPSSASGSMTNRGHGGSNFGGVQNFSGISILPKANIAVQPKLKINEPGDKYEQEADKVADQIMRMPLKMIASSSGDEKKPNGINLGREMVQRKCSACGKTHKSDEHDHLPPVMPMVCPKCSRQKDKQIQTKRITSTIQRPMELLDEGESGTIQTKRNTDSAPAVTPEINADIRSIEGGGQPMSKSDRSFFEPRFGVDFSGIRIHNDARSAQLAKSIDARAFTLGNNIVFGSGEYSSNSSSRKLMAHELTHTLQQGGQSFGNNTSAVPNIQRQGGTVGGFFRNIGRGIVSIFGDELEFSEEEIEEYLIVLEGGDIEDDFISDDKARAVVRKWMAGEMELRFQIKALLIKEMISGFTGNADERAILDILIGSPHELTQILGLVGPDELRSEFHGAESRELESIIAPWENADENVIINSTCPNGIKTITVDSVRLHGSTISPSAQMIRANRAFAGCCVRFVAGTSPPQETEEKTHSWLGGDTDIDRTQGAGCGNVGGEEQAMFDGATSDHNLSSRMRVFYVASFSTSGLAYSIPPYCATGAEAPYVNHAVIGNGGHQDTLAHEFGHILINSGDHTSIDNSSDRSNLMFAPGRTASNLDASQCARIYANA